MKRRSFIGILSALPFLGWIKPEEQQLCYYWETDLAKSLDPDYVNACREAGMPAKHFNNLSAVKILHMQGWVSAQYSQIRKYDRFMVIRPDGYEVDRYDHKIVNIALSDAKPAGTTIHGTDNFEVMIKQPADRPKI